MPYASFFNVATILWWMTCFWWQLAQNITIHIIGVSLKRGCFEVNAEKIPTFAGCHLATHPKSRSCGRRGICLQVILLFVLESSYPSRFCPEEVALLVGFRGTYPPTCYVILRFELPQINEV